MPRCAVPRHAVPWQMAMEGPQKLAFTIPLMEPLPPQYYVRLVSDNWLQVGGGGGSGATQPPPVGWGC